MKLLRKDLRISQYKWKSCGPELHSVEVYHIPTACSAVCSDVGLTYKQQRFRALLALGRIVREK